MKCPHCNQGDLREDIAIFTSNLDPSGSESSCQKGYTCRICGYWEDIISVKSEVPKEKRIMSPVMALHRIEDGERTKAFINKFFEYITFLRTTGYCWDKIALRLNLSRTPVYKRYYEIEEERGLK